MDEKKCKEVFDVFVNDRTEFVNTQYLITLLRAVGLNPLEKEAQSYLKGTDAYGSGVMELETFIEIANKCKERSATTERLIEVFEKSDENSKGTIAISEMRYLMTKLGDNITEEEFNVILRDAGMETDTEIDYRKFVNFLVNRESW